MEEHNTHTWGFRLSVTDVLILIGAVVLKQISTEYLEDFSWAFPIVAFHFFLFCNVFRIDRSYEYFWAITFIGNVLGHLFLFRFDWFSILLLQTPVTSALLLFELLSEQYHGIACSWLNPRCPDYRFREEEEKRGE